MTWNVEYGRMNLKLNTAHLLILNGETRWSLYR
jgi:hypothetical protein